MPDDNIVQIGNGEIGGKGTGLLKIRNLATSDDIAFPKTVFVTTSVFKTFVEHNKMENLIDKVEKDDFNETDCETLKRAFLNGTFPEDARESLFGPADLFDTPMIARSSSLLEDQKGAAFAGKYESIFWGNQGTKETRRHNLLEAIKKVYSTTYNPNALAYRVKHGFLDRREEMAVILQSVVGQRYKSFYLPAMAGVAFSQNGYCWNKQIKKNDGLVRLVFGLGTRAVGRGYVRLFSPAKPAIRPEGTDTNSIQKCSQKKVDVIDLSDNAIKTLHFRELIKDGFDCYPNAQGMISLRDGSHLYRPVSKMWDSNHIPVITMEGILSSPWMQLNIPKTIYQLLKKLEASLGFPIDMEFAINMTDKGDRALLYVLQVRPLSEREGHQPLEIPQLDTKDIIITTTGSLPTSHVPNIEYLVFVDDMAYHDWPHREKQTVARMIGKINEALKGKRFILIGPGRWGSWNPDLGVPVSYAEIANCVMLIEIARRKATYVPEVSLGSHFFQDLIEDNIAYLPIYPDEANVLFKEDIFQKSFEFSKLFKDDYYRQFDRLIKIVHVPTLFKKRMAHAIMNGELEKAVLYIA